MVNNGPTTTTTKTTTAKGAQQHVKHSSPIYFSDALFRNKRLKQKRLKWALKISKAATRQFNKNNNNNNNNTKTDYRNKLNKCGLLSLPPDITINLLSDDEIDHKQTTTELNSHKSFYATTTTKLKPLPQLVVFPTHQLQISNSPNITLIPVKPLPAALASTLQLTTQLNHNSKRKRKSQKPKRLSEPTIINKESIVLSDDSNDATPQQPAACSTPNHIELQQNGDYNNTATLITPRIAQVDEEVTVSLVPRCSAAGSSCSTSKTKNSVDLFPMVPDETTVQTIISNRLYELSLTKLREGLATSGVGDFADDNKQQIQHLSGGRTNFNLPPRKPLQQPVALKLSSDLSISLISDDDEEETQQDPRLSAEKLLRQQPHLSVRPVGVVTVNQPPKRRKLG